MRPLFRRVMFQSRLRVPSLSGCSFVCSFPGEGAPPLGRAQLTLSGAPFRDFAKLETCMTLEAVSLPMADGVRASFLRDLRERLDCCIPHMLLGVLQECHHCSDDRGVAGVSQLCERRLMSSDVAINKFVQSNSPLSPTAP